MIENWTSTFTENDFAITNYVWQFANPIEWEPVKRFTAVGTCNAPYPFQIWKQFMDWETNIKNFPISKALDEERKTMIWFQVEKQDIFFDQI